MHPIQVSVYLYITNYFQWFLYYIARHIDTLVQIPAPV